MRSRLFVAVGLALLMAAATPWSGILADASTPMPAAEPGPGWQVLRHVDPAAGELYTAQTLTSMRLDVGLSQERWLGRPFWVEPLGGRGVRVAVVDTGIDPAHPDLVGSVVAWADFVHGRTIPYDDDTHGTHVAGIIAAHGHFQWRPDQHYFPLGATGVAPKVDLLVAKAMDRDGDGDAASVARAILWAIDPNGDGDRSDGAHIINLSIGLETPPSGDPDGPLPGPLTLPVIPQDAEAERRVREAIDIAVRAGAIVVVAAGNHEAGARQSTVSFPGNLDNVITVGAVDPDGSAAMFSNEGTPGSGKPDLMAPGILLSTFPIRRDAGDTIQDGYTALGGTSMAAPVVAGTIALMMEADPTLGGLGNDGDHSQNTERIRQILTDTAVPVGPGYNAVYGHGILSATAAVSAVDTGDGPVNWDALLVLLLAVTALVAVVVMRRRRRDIALRTRMHAREAQAARAAARMAASGDETMATWDEQTPVGDGQPDAPDDGAHQMPPDAASDVPADQRPPWQA